VHILVTNTSNNKQLHRPTRHPPRSSYRRDHFVTQTPRQMFVYLLLTEYKYLTACAWKGYHAVVISHSCDITPL